MSKKTNQKENLSPEEIERLEKQKIAYLTKEYAAQNKLLKLEAEYERLQTEIVESKLRRHMAMLKYSELIASQENAAKAQEEESKEELNPQENV